MAGITCSHPAKNIFLYKEIRCVPQTAFLTADFPYIILALAVGIASLQTAVECLFMFRIYKAERFVPIQEQCGTVPKLAGK